MATTDQSIRSYLDSLSQLPGSILYRNTITWEALPPGQQGQLLTIDAAGLPAWTARGSYFPAMFQFPNPTDRFDKQNIGITNAPLTGLRRITRDANPTNELVTRILGGGIACLDEVLLTTGQYRVSVRNSTVNTFFQVQSQQTLNDGQPHYIYWQFTPATAAFEFIVDGQPADDTSWPGRLVNTGFFPNDANADYYVPGPSPSIDPFLGSMGCHGFKQTDLLNWQDFMDSEGWPKPIDHDTWAQWLGQPPIWHESGALQWNRGSAGPLNITGTPTIADPQDWN